MPAFAKFLTGLAVALAAGWISHAPLGRGEAFVDRLEARAEARIHETRLAGLQVRFPRDPLSRQAVLSGEADEFQREGMGLLPGIDDRIRAVPGVSGVRWEE